MDYCTLLMLSRRLYDQKSPQAHFDVNKKHVTLYSEIVNFLYFGYTVTQSLPGVSDPYKITFQV